MWVLGLKGEASMQVPKPAFLFNVHHRAKPVVKKDVVSFESLQPSDF